MEKKENLEKEISTMSIRVKGLIEKYKKEEYTPIPETIKKQVFSHLIKASTVLAKERLCKKILAFDSDYQDDLPKDFESLSIVPSIRTAVSICKNHYSYDFIVTVREIIGYITSDIDNKDAINYFKQSIGITNYIKLNKNYDKIEELMLSIYTVEELSESSFNSLLELYGLRDILSSFEEEIKIIPDIEDKNLKNAVIDYIFEFIDFDSFNFEK